MGQHVQKLEIRFALKNRNTLDYGHTRSCRPLVGCSGLRAHAHLRKLLELRAGLPNGVKELTVVLEIKPVRKTDRHGVDLVNWVPNVHTQDMVQDFNDLVANITSLLKPEHFVFEVFYPCCPSENAKCERKTCALVPLYKKTLKEYLAGENDLAAVKLEMTGYRDH